MAIAMNELVRTDIPITFSDAPLGFGPGGPLPVPSPWTNYGTYIGYGIGGVIVGTPTGGQKGPGTLNAQNIYVNGVSINPGDFLPLTGGTITGNLTINGGFTLSGGMT